MSVKASQAQAAPPRVGTWVLAGLLGLAVVLLYRAPALWLWNAWWTDPYYTHGVLVAALAVGLAAWRLRAAPASRPQGVWPLLGVPLSGALYVLGFALGSSYLLLWSAWAALAALALATGGLPRLRLVAAPLLLLALAIPTPWTLEAGVALQGLATGAAVAMLALFQVPLTVDLYTFHVGDIAFEVTAACSGFQSAVSLLALGAVTATVIPMGVMRRRLVIGAAVPIALVLNVLRILLVVWVGLRWGAEAAEGFFHSWSGLLLFLVELAALLAIAGALRRPKEAPAIG